MLSTQTEVLLTSWAQSPVRSRNTHSGLQPAAQRDPQPPHPSLLMCALDVCLSLSKNCKTSVQLGDRNPGRKQTHLEGGCSKPHTPSESQILQACSRPGAESRPPIHLSDLGRRHEPASDNRNSQGSRTLASFLTQQGK